MNQKVYYVAHPYTRSITPYKLEYDNVKDCIDCCNRLLDLGLVIIAPIVMNHWIQKKFFRQPDFWYQQDFEIIKKCDGIILCPGWTRSTGCINEKTLAEGLGKEILYYNNLIKQ